MREEGETHSEIDTKMNANAILQRRQLKYSTCPYSVVENWCKKRVVFCKGMGIPGVIAPDGQESV